MARVFVGYFGIFTQSISLWLSISSQSRNILQLFLFPFTSYFAGPLASTYELSYETQFRTKTHWTRIGDQSQNENGRQRRTIGT
jgi:hypothetical protein